MNDFDAKIGTRIKKVRTAKNMSQEQLAEQPVCPPIIYRKSNEDYVLQN
ncbi:MAG: helix-turn-helix transcriptional regulator [Firmicutes bacterium]|jgi:hypothetical protein|nr:helix-turn-helix transcriptional regulator [Bacillota bacterium]